MCFKASMDKFNPVIKIKESMCAHMRSRIDKRTSGFTLAELLIALAILGIIAAFTIPKILDSSRNGNLNAVARESASMIRDAYSYYKIDTFPEWNLLAIDADRFIGKMNYVNIDTATTAAAMQNPPAGESKLENCSATTPCVLLHSGAIIQYDTTQTFSATNPSPNIPTSTGAVFFNVDPDGFKGGAGRFTVSLFYNGRVTSGQAANEEGITYHSPTLTPQTTDPSFFQYWQGIGF
jgi:prepilin-type N-terminal cleavage/methylation domain-containing protein